MPLAPDEFTAADFNAAWRNGFGPRLSGADKTAMAAYLGVSVRTIQRWTTSAGEMRNPIPSRLENVPRNEWPVTYQRRGEVTRRIQYGGANEEECGPETAEFGQVRGSLSASDVWAAALEREVIDPWLSLAWCYYYLAKTGRGWEVRVVYDKRVSPGIEPRGAQ